MKKITFISIFTFGIIFRAWVKQILSNGRRTGRRAAQQYIKPTSSICRQHRPGTLNKALVVGVNTASQRTWCHGHGRKFLTCGLILRSGVSNNAQLLDDQYHQHAVTQSGANDSGFREFYRLGFGSAKLQPIFCFGLLYSGTNANAPERQC